jgi:signal transduction histidine kinase
MNSVKHSEARAVWLRLSTVQRVVELTIEDDGCGFDPGKTTNSRHFGLELLRERAEAALGELEIRSKPGDGTLVVVRIPCD